MHCSSLEEALTKGLNTFHSGRTCANGHINVVEYINSRSPLKTKCYECLKLAGAKKKAKARSDPDKRLVINERVKRINRARYANDPEYKNKNLMSRFEWEAGREVKDIEGKTSEYLAKAIGVHGDKYDYSKFRYVNNRVRVSIVCKIHGEFKQTVHAHINEKRDCPECMKSFSVSKSENAVAGYIESLEIQIVRSSRAIIPPYELDIYCPDLKVAIEYCGLRWHSTQMVKSSDYRDILSSDRKMRGKHYDKYVACKDKGIKLITIFEDEWIKKPGAVKKTISNALGASLRICHARQLELSTCDVKSVRGFFNSNHLQGSAQSGVAVVGKYKGDIVCAMSFSRAYSERGSDDGSWELNRFCSTGSIPGAASKLFKHFIINYNPERVISYSDNRWFDGRMYNTLGFQHVADVPPDYFVIRQQDRWHKTVFKRNRIPGKIKEFGLDLGFDPTTDPRTELHMTALMGCGRIYDCGKKKWVFT